ncbi:hypothetical protein [Paraburkholderia sp. J41]|uniref:hypothetical protein n=1 Tax=Paraburkholderia sp. J41 TaxID=2805433 RepID=UPI002AC338BC|nr:hypothetical protein [Paraburkholderia sp. J41]
MSRIVAHGRISRLCLPPRRISGRFRPQAAEIRVFERIFLRFIHRAYRKNTVGAPARAPGRRVRAAAGGAPVSKGAAMELKCALGFYSVFFATDFCTY